ncbi:RagB/SusD family nutrient uptake outer membrane protein [Dinghuibacter silviterrae]|uniref:SusD-like starch-binding protein associating with outer membrane n=1 Tax=Dinghuibacter silviterrae TaxID=1539049 RepID=A0A4V3GKZ0_9BACT|nr:RagB/SusD family nutrient uptake outer membrane protein [Dinghuibacter silviterrae]TDW97482.1 SusD-like starch-binding protein associating with outer membrane [Dinghuibacter silviterrae]
MYRLYCLFCLATLASCSKVLDQTPEYTIAQNNFWQTSNDAESAATGIYPAVQSLAQQFPLAFDACSDATTGLLANYSPFSQHAIPVDNAVVAAYWDNNYTGIGRANDLLKHVPAISDSLFTPGEKARILGEAYFLRAYFYYGLVQAFGAVPIVTTPYTSFNADFTIGRSSVDSVYLLILSDLHAAESGLTQTWAAQVDTRGRATLGGAQALLAKVFLSLKNYDSAAANALAVMNNPTYSLVLGSAAYSNMFSTSGKNGAESIFEIQFVSATNQSNGLFSFYMPTTGLPSGIQPGQYQIAPTAKIMSAYAPGDIRAAAALGTSSAAVPYVNKYDRLINGTEPDIIALRLADIILVRAEALNDLGQTAAATSLLDTIRRRAFALPLSSASVYDYPDADDQANGYTLALAIENERYKELAFEGYRFFDLVRTGRAAAVLGITANQSLWPIPLYEIGVNPRLLQNPGY